MSLLDGRHRWVVTERKGATITHTCRACGRVQSFELLVPNAVIEALWGQATKPNPYRDMFR